MIQVKIKLFGKKFNVRLVTILWKMYGMTVILLGSLVMIQMMMRWCS